MRKLFWQSISLALVCCIISACGFSADQHTPLPQLKTLFLLSRQPYTPLNLVIRKTFERNGVHLVKHPHDANYTLVIIDHRLKHRNLGMSASDYYAKRIYYYIIEYQLLARNQKPVTDVRSVMVQSIPRASRVHIAGLRNIEDIKRGLRERAAIQLYQEVNSPVVADAMHHLGSPHHGTR